VHEVEIFNKAAASLLRGVSVIRKKELAASQNQSRSCIGLSFRSQSKNLFDKLTADLQACKVKRSKHRAMLQLRHAEFLGDPKPNTELFMLLNPCWDSATWQETHCSIMENEADNRR
jgi:hypothetical protein